LLDRLAFFKVLIFNSPRLLREDGEGKRIPRHEHVILFDLLLILDVDLATVDDIVVSDLAAAVVDESDLGLTTERNEFTRTVLNDLHVRTEFHGTVHCSGVLGLLLEACRTTHVERTHRELRSRLTDRLSGDNADSLTDLDRVTGRK